MQVEFVRLLDKAVSHERLEGYSRRGSIDCPQSLYAHYAWNVSLSESLYPLLQGIEIALRNSLHNAASQRFGREDWFEDNRLIHPVDRGFVNSARETIAKSHKPTEPARIVAELSFGFWTSLFDVRYEQRFWPWLLKPICPYMPRTLRTRAELSRRLNGIRRLRNRVFHHEPIWYWRDLTQQHRELAETLYWINPAMEQFVGMLDRFPQVMSQGCRPYHGLLEGVSLRLVR